MALESGTYTNDLNSANPTATDTRREGDDHLRLIKSTLQNTVQLTKTAATKPASAAAGAGRLLHNSNTDTVHVDTGSQWEPVGNTQYGLGTYRSGVDFNHDIVIRAGRILAEDFTEMITLSSPIIKRLDFPWAVGTNAGGMDTGAAITPNQLYYIWVIYRDDTGVTDALFSTSGTAPTMPTNYGHKALIGAIVTNSSSDIISYTQAGRTFWLKHALATDGRGTRLTSGAITSSGRQDVMTMLAPRHSTVLGSLYCQTETDNYFSFAVTANSAAWNYALGTEGPNLCFGRLPVAPYNSIPMRNANFVVKLDQNSQFELHTATDHPDDASIAVMSVFTHAFTMETIGHDQTDVG